MNHYLTIGCESNRESSRDADFKTPDIRQNRRFFLCLNIFGFQRVAQHVLKALFLVFYV